MSKSLATVALNVSCSAMDATDEVVVAGFCAVFAAEFAGLSRGLSLEGGVAVRADDEYGAATCPVNGMLELGCVEKFSLQKC